MPRGCGSCRVPKASRFVCFFNYYTNILYKLTFFAFFLLYLVANRKNDTFFLKKKSKKSIDKVFHLCYIIIMINQVINQRITVTLPRSLVSRLNAYCVSHSYLRFSDVLRQALEEFLRDDV